MGSIQICFQDDEIFQSLDTVSASLRTILTGDEKLAHINSCIPELSSKLEPVTMDTSSCQMLALAERVCFRSEMVCSISVTGMQLKWKDLSIDAARVNLEVEDTAALVRSLENFCTVGVMTHGFPSLSMMHEMYRLDRKCSVDRLTIEPGACLPQNPPQEQVSQ